MRLLLISNAFPDTVLGGYGHAARDIADVARRHGHDVEVLTSNWPASCREDPASALRLLKWHLPGLRPVGLTCPFEEVILEPNAGIVEDVIARFRPDRILLMNLQGLGILSILAPVINSGIPTTAYLMDNWPRIRTFESGWNFDWLLSPLLEHSGIQWIACSRVLAQEIETLSGGAVVIDSFVPAWVKLDDGSGSRRRDPKKMVFISSLSKEKGAIETLEACLRVRDRFPEVSLDFFGDGPIRGDLEARAMEASEGSITFRGWVSREEVRRQLPSYGSLVFPTWSREPFGFVMLEAMAAGVPVVSTNHGGTERIPYDCFVSCHQTVNSVVRAVTTLIENDELACSVAGKALELVRGHFEEELVVRSLLDKIEGFCSAKGTGGAGLRQSSTLEVLGSWLEERPYDALGSAHFTRLLKLYSRLPFSVRQVVRPLGLRVLGAARKVAARL